MPFNIQETQISPSRQVSKQIVYDTIEQISASLSHIEKRPIALHEPWFCGNESRYTQDCIESGWVSSVGDYVKRFEQDLANYTKIPNVVATVNGTSALHLGLHSLGLGPNDEVLLPALTFVATANAITYCGATPHFVDACSETLGVDAAKLRIYLTSLMNKTGQNRHTGKRIRALIVMHTLGHPSNLSALQSVCDDFGLELIEDAAESLGSFYKGQHTGGYGRFGILSFNGNKIMTTGGGGALVTFDEELATKARHLSQTAKLVHPYEFHHDDIGFNYRLPNINAALGVAQLENLPLFIKQKRLLAAHYETCLSHYFKPLRAESSNHWLNAIRLPAIGSLEDRNSVIESLAQRGIMVRPLWKNMASLPIYQQYPSMNLDTTGQLERSIICLPSSPFLSP